VIASIIGNTVASPVSPSDNLSVTYSEWVYQETGGTLDFIIQATNNTVANGDIIDRVTTGSFAGNGAVTTDVGFNSSVPGLATISGGYNPGAADRSGVTGPTVGFDFTTDVPQGGQTDYLIIKTNATWYIPGTVSFQDGVTASGAGFGVAPEPNMTCLLSVLAIGILGIAYRRKKNVVKNTEV